ncbi:M14 family metallopeptidase [Paenibacillus allorhizosphaerae]|uniref:Gamma-D-glutamyl-L-diamino acid endopeptidase 1 n=1 Tax=Paenibacillus allorhizosphaerae TaxID=2849866 RepID=A0ABN7TT99_9BACL|nr:M14 family metallopeptidase [Paenibacillus allorhizosphaerae]CAG7650511.1 Gamma-D-glutamyl-L-diamino acid endopeptidase 1 [Paenibacillus allorhizosphaerae]
MNRYPIQAGDSFAQLAGRFGISIADLMTANPGIDPRRLRIGQTVMIPAGPHASIIDTTKAYGYCDLTRDLAALGTAYPFLQIGSIGYSTLGRTIPVVRIGSGTKEVHYNGAFHANEWITSLLLVKFVEDCANACCNSGQLRTCNVKELFGHVSLFVVPMVNPDGVELVHGTLCADEALYERLLHWNRGSRDFSGWKANVRGVDLNDQFPAFWDAERDRRDVPGPGPRDYTGEAPLTEPEAQAMEAFTRSRDFHLVMALHTQGQEIYWNYRDMEPEGAEKAAIRLGEASGYRPVKLFCSDAGYKDWFIQEYRRYGFTVEAGIGVNPLPIEQFDAIYEDMIGLLLEGLQI